MQQFVFLYLRILAPFRFISPFLSIFLPSFFLLRVCCHVPRTPKQCKDIRTWIINESVLELMYVCVHSMCTQYNACAILLALFQNCALSVQHLFFPFSFPHLFAYIHHRHTSDRLSARKIRSITRSNPIRTCN